MDVVFPAALRTRYDFEDDQLVVAGGEADCYLLRDRATGEIVFGKVYRQGNSPNVEVLKALNSAAPDKVVRLIDSAAATPTSRAWEVTEFMRHGNLAELAESEGGRLRPERVREILAEIVDALQHVHSQEVEHKDLKPANILVRSLDPLDLVLTDFGISSTMTATVKLTRRHRTVEYAPPEAVGGKVVREKWDSWSLGMVLVELLTGKHPLARMGAQDDDLQIQEMESIVAVGDVDDLVHGVEGEEWVRLCRGLLRRKPESRWGIGEVLRWLENPNDSTLQVAQEQATRSAHPFTVRNTDYHSPEALAECLRGDGALLARIWQTRVTELVTWVEDQLGLVELARVLAAIQRANEGLDSQLMRVLSALDPSKPPFFKGREITAASLVALANTLTPANQNASEWLVSLYEKDVLAKAAALSPQKEGLEQILASWKSEVASFEASRSAIASSSNGAASPAALSGQAFAPLLAAATPGSSALRALRVRASAAATPAARSCLWFQTLGDPASASAANALLMITTAHLAEAEVRQAEADREGRNNQLWGTMAFGAGLGGLIGVGWWAATSSWCRAGDNLCISSGWFTQQIGTFDLLFAAAALVSALAVLVSVHQQTGSGRY